VFYLKALALNKAYGKSPYTHPSFIRWQAFYTFQTNHKYHQLIDSNAFAFSLSPS
jgi:hypothetical protein